LPQKVKSEKKMKNSFSNLEWHSAEQAAAEFAETDSRT
jgi:hypothetical protein